MTITLEYVSEVVKTLWKPQINQSNFNNPEVEATQFKCLN